ncbi:MAG TPA: DNA repair protein RecN [Elusimicrobia bacterium]|nr:DNA repair protein RecN [Elusimicrobiota bacterium]
MLKKLAIKNFALIEELTLEPGPGLNVFTGETGAGKSIIISALGFLLGERAGSDILRPGSALTEVCGEFSAAGLERELLESFGLLGGSFTLKRQSDSKGRARAFIDARQVPLSRVSALGSALVDFHGQNEHQSLLKTEVQRALLDRYGRLEKQAGAVREAFLRAQALRGRLEAVSMSETERERLLDLYRFQLKEITDAALKSGEEAELETLYPRLKNAEKLFLLSNAAYELIAGSEGAARGNLEKALEKLKTLGELDEGAPALAARLETALIEVCDISEELYKYSKGLDTDPGRLDACLSRLEKISSLKKKYGSDENAVAEKGAELENKIAELEDLSLDRAEAQKALEKSEALLLGLARSLHAARSAAALKLAAQTKNEASDLGFKELRFEAAVEAEEGNISSYGMDAVEYLFSANPGYPLRPLRFTASGGEMSRLMLALKTVLAAADRIGALVFDEVDTGVGAVTGRLVGQKLRRLASEKQIFCITHLPQVAAFADKHFIVEKISLKKSSTVTARELSAADRTAEIARMLGGKQKSSAQAVKHAAELLAESRQAEG